jgi:hypothetical protein
MVGRMNNTANSKPGADSKITPELVYRVSELVAKGISIRLALEAECVTFDAYKKHLQRHPELRAVQAAAKIKFLNVTIGLISKKNGPMLRWLLERRHSRDFSPKTGEADENESDFDTETETEAAPKPPTQTIAGVPEHLVGEGRKNDQKL